MKMELCPLMLRLTLWVCCCVGMVTSNTHALDRQSTCGQTLPVFDSDLTLMARSNVAPANPPLECIVYLESGYQASDGRGGLQIIVEQLQIKDCSVYLDFFNGHGASGQYLRKLGCGSSSTDIIYSNGRLVTVRFSRPLELYHPEYAITVTVRAYEDKDAIGTQVGVDTLSVGAIIGIVVGLLFIIAIAILLAWCCCTGYINRFLGKGEGGAGRGWGGKKKALGPPHITYTPHDPHGAGSMDSNLEKVSTTSSTQQLNAMGWKPGGAWGRSVNGQEGGGNFRQGVPRRAPGRNYYNAQEDRFQPTRAERQGAAPASQADPHVYEPYENDNNDDNVSPRFRKRSEDPRPRARGSRSSRNREGEEAGGGRETTIDDPGSGSGSAEEEKGEDSTEELPPKVALHREGSEIGVDTIISPTHVNAAVRASIPDLTTHDEEDVINPPSPRPSKRTRGHGQGHGQGNDPDPMGLPPEAFDPVFITPSSQEGMGDWRGGGPAGMMQPPMAVPFMPYGFVPMVPGQQMYSYAYQTAPGGVPGAQGAYFVQSVPTSQGDIRNTAIAVTSEHTPHGQGSSRGHRSRDNPPPGAPDFSSTPREGRRGGGKELVKPSLSSSFAPLAVPPPVDSPQRSVAVKSFADPDSGVQTTQVLWTDTVPDPSDPAPGESSQVTRKTTTRITTRSGIGDLPQQTALLDEPDPNPAFLAPSAASLPPAALTPSADNLDYYSGPRSGGAGHRSEQALPPRRLVHESGARNTAIRDRVTLADSSVV